MFIMKTYLGLYALVVRLTLTLHQEGSHPLPAMKTWIKKVIY